MKDTKPAQTEKKVCLWWTAEIIVQGSFFQNCSWVYADSEVQTCTMINLWFHDRDYFALLSSNSNYLMGIFWSLPLAPKSAIRIWHLTHCKWCCATQISTGMKQEKSTRTDKDPMVIYIGSLESLLAMLVNLDALCHVEAGLPLTRNWNSGVKKFTSRKIWNSLKSVLESKVWNLRWTVVSCLRQSLDTGCFVFKWTDRLGNIRSAR